MRVMLLAACAIALTGCRKDPPAASNPAAVPTHAEREAPSAAPIQTGRRIVSDFGAQQQAAQERDAELDSMLNQDR